MVDSVEQGVLVTVIGAYDTMDDDIFYFEYALEPSGSPTSFGAQGVNTFEGAATEVLDTSALSPGTYTIKVTDSMGNLSGTATLIVTAVP